MPRRIFYLCLLHYFYPFVPSQWYIVVYGFYFVAIMCVLIISIKYFLCVSPLFLMFPFGIYDVTAAI